MEPSRIQAIDHVNIEAAYGTEEALRWFYSEVGLLDEVERRYTDRQGLCFRSARIEIRIHLKENAEVEPALCRVTIAVPSLEDVEVQLLERQLIYQPLTGVVWTDRRIGTHDPAGNRVELKQEWPVAPL